MLSDLLHQHYSTMIRVNRQFVSKSALVVGTRDCIQLSRPPFFACLCAATIVVLGNVVFALVLAGNFLGVVFVEVVACRHQSL